MKKAVGRIFLVLSIILGVYLTCFAGNTVTYMQCVISEEELEQILASREENTSLLEGIRLNGEDLFYDRTSGIFYYSLIEGSSQAFDPNVRIISPYKDVQVAFSGGGLDRKMIEENQAVSILVYTQEFYCRYHLVCTTLPLMNIRCAEDIGNEYVPMEITLFDNRRGAANRVIHSSGCMRIRGGYSRTYPKLGYRFQLTTESLGAHDRSNQISLLGMRQDDDWLLYAGYNDQEKVRNVFSSNLWKYSCASDNEERIDAGVEYRYLELFINGEYWGLYALGYPVDKKQLAFGDDVSKEALYKLTQWVDERNIVLSEEGAVYGYEQTGVNEQSGEGWGLLLEYYDNLSSNYADSVELYEWIDIDNLIDTYLFIKLIQGVDHAGKNQVYEIFNMYLAIRTDSNGGRKGLYIPWDMDRTWGNGFDDIPYNMAVDGQVPVESGYLNQIITNQDTDIWEKVFDKYWSLRSGLWSNEALGSLIDSYEEDIFGSGAYLREMERWPDGIYADPKDKLDMFRLYVMVRLAETDLYFEKMEDFSRKSIFIRRSADYKHFIQGRFLIEINDKELIKIDGRFYFFH